MKRSITLGLAALAALTAVHATALGARTPPSASELAPVHGTYAPKIVPANFVATVDNRYLPFEPGTAFHYRGVRGTTPQRDDEVVTRQRKRILGVTCTAARCASVSRSPPGSSSACAGSARAGSPSMSCAATPA